MILIVGAGFMGRGIAQVCAQHNFSVYLIDTEDKVLADARKDMLSSLDKLFYREQVSEDLEAVLKRIVFYKSHCS
jgi:3-hydroxybutyryl-CoA dehydrogenase